MSFLKPRCVTLFVLVLALTAPVTAGPIASWTPVLVGSTGGHFPDGTIDAPFRLLVHPTDPNTLYLGTGVIPTPGTPPPAADGMWKTTDGGTTWTSVNEAATGDPVLDFELFTSDTSVLGLALCESNPDVIAVATNPKGVFRSEDAGASWSWVSAGIVHTDNDSDHCGAIAHGDETFDTVDSRWTASAIAIDPNNCDVMYAGVADINAVDINNGTGDHPGMYSTADGGLTWAELNGSLGPRVDALACHSLTLKSKTIAPLDAEVRSDGTVVLATTEQMADASIFSKTATSQQRMWTNTGSGNWTQVSSGLGGSQVTQTAAFGELAAVSVSAGFLTLAPAENFYVVSHFGIGTKILFGGDTTLGKSKGLFASLDLSAWTARDSGIPVVNDANNSNAQNTGGVTVNPNNAGIWVVGTSLSDSFGVDGSQVYISPGFGGSWLNGGPFLGGLSTSPGGFTESSVLFVEWNANGSCLYATVLWDFVNGVSTADDGVYKVCLF